jgi:hypothetical protein
MKTKGLNRYFKILFNKFFRPVAYRVVYPFSGIYDCWFWQLEGECNIQIGTGRFILHKKDSLLVPAKYSETIYISVLTGHVLKVIQNPIKE